MKSFFAKLFGSGSQLSELERLVLNCVSDRLDASTAALWNRQVQLINKIQRLPEGVEVNFYRMKNGRPSFDDKLAFPNRTDELLVAKVQLGLPSLRARLTASVWCVKGFLFSIEYESSINYFEEAIGMDPRPELTITCELAADLTLTAGDPSPLRAGVS
jgi:hypothetical protein